MATLLVPPKLDGWAKASIRPYSRKLVNPASIDLRLGDRWLNPKTGTKHRGRYRLGMGCSVLGITMEEITIRPGYAADLKLKTTPARLGINHTLAGWIDPGYVGKLTLTLYTIDRSALLVPGMRIAQIVVWQLDEEPEWNYADVGHYMYQEVPTLAVTEGDE